MLIIQHLWRRWSLPSEQSPLPAVFDLPPLPDVRAPGWGHEIDLSGDTPKDALRRLHRGGGDEWRPLHWRLSGGGVEIGLYKPTHAAIRTKWPYVHEPNWLFHLAPGESGRVRWNGRFRAWDGKAEHFEDHAYRIAVAVMAGPDLFRSGRFDQSYDWAPLRADAGT